MDGWTDGHMRRDTIVLFYLKSNNNHHVLGVLF